MDLFLQFANLKLFLITVFLFVITIFYRFLFYKSPLYTYSLSDTIANGIFLKSSSFYKFLKFFLRFFLLLFLLLAISRLRMPDAKSRSPVEGVDIMLVLDLSGSMNAFSDLNNRISRIDIAKKEIINFIKNRPNDQIGLTIFANGALVRAPLTFDKELITNIIKDTKIGVIPEDSTFLNWGILTGLNRLMASDSKTRILIVTTDGQPTDNIPPDNVISIANKSGIKIYTIGVGSHDGDYISDQFGRIARIHYAINQKLLEYISQKTGGKFFEAKNPDDMEQIYKEIDALEKTEYQTPTFNSYHEFFYIFLWIALILFVFEVLFFDLWWQGL